MSANDKIDFQRRENWINRPAAAFTAFSQDVAFVRTGKKKAEFENPLNDRALSKSSSTMYSHMFGRFCKWMEQQGLNLVTVSANDISTFLNERRVKEDGSVVKERESLIRMRYLRLLERVFAYLAPILERPGEKNPASFAAREIFVSGNRKDRGADKKTVFLSEADEKKFVAALMAPIVVPEDGRHAQLWEEKRDRALQAVMLGAGLTVTEVANLSAERIVCWPDHVEIRMAKKVPHERANPRVRSSVEPIVREWMAHLHELPVPVGLAFPNARGGALARSSIYRQLAETMERAGLSGLDHKGGRILRNTYAIRELARHTPEEVQQLLGLNHIKSVQWYVLAAGLKP